MASIFFTVTNDLSYDQRMIRICGSLASAGHRVTLVGRKRPGSKPLADQPFSQKRLNCFFDRGKAFYLEYNLRLFIYLLGKKIDCICAVDLDTIIPCYHISKLKKAKRVLDSHEYFTQQKEVVTRHGIYRFWLGVEKRYLPKFDSGYTVSASIAREFSRLYGVEHEVIRNLPLLKRAAANYAIRLPRIIFYQGAVNEARGFEWLLPAMKELDAELHIYGDGNFMEQAKELIKTNNLGSKVFMKGMLLPAELDAAIADAWIGINLVENTGLNQYYSLANKFFDFIQHGKPQLTMDFPEYRKINDVFEVALLIEDLRVETIRNAINKLLSNEALYNRLKQNCQSAAQTLNWQVEEKKLLAFYKKVIG